MSAPPVAVSKRKSQLFKPAGLQNLFKKHPHPRICFLILEREEGRGGGKERDVREKHPCKTNITWLPPVRTPEMGVEPTAFWCRGRHSN